jgi:hypothetical protein
LSCACNPAESPWRSLVGRRWRGGYVRVKAPQSSGTVSRRGLHGREDEGLHSRRLLSPGRSRCKTRLQRRTWRRGSRLDCRVCGRMECVLLSQWKHLMRSQYLAKKMAFDSTVSLLILLGRDSSDALTWLPLTRWLLLQPFPCDPSAVTKP